MNNFSATKNNGLLKIYTEDELSDPNLMALRKRVEKMRKTIKDKMPPSDNDNEEDILLDRALRD